MNHLFHVLTLIFIINEIGWILNPVSKTESNKEYKELQLSNKGKKWDDYNSEYKDVLLSKGIVGFVIFLWMIIGVFTYNWVAFVAMLIFNIAIVSPISKLFRFSMGYTILHWLNSIIGLAFSLFVILNSYHLRIDLYELLLTYLKLN